MRLAPAAASTRNLAVGGTFEGDVDADTPFPGKMVVDWVRAYAKPQP